MSLGNGNPKEGDKGSNFNFELKMLQGLEAIANALDGGSGGGSGDPALNPGPAFSSGVFSADDIITFSDVDIDLKASWGTYQKIGNIVSTDINIDVTKITNATGSIYIALPVTVVGDITSSLNYVTGTMNVSSEIGDLLVSYDFEAIAETAVVFNYAFSVVTGATVIRLRITYVYNTNIAVLMDAPITL